jgi:hypothetical protein
MANLLKIFIGNLIGEKDMTIGTKIMNRRTDSRSTIGSHHAPSHDNASKRKLLVSTLNLPWLGAAASKFKSSVVPTVGWVPIFWEVQGKSIGGDLDVDDEGPEQRRFKPVQSLHHGSVGYQPVRTQIGLAKKAMSL